MRQPVIYMFVLLLLLAPLFQGTVSAEARSCWAINTLAHGDSLDYLGTSLHLDSTARPHIVYSTYTSLEYAYYDGTAWHFTTVDDASAREFPSLALDSLGRPHISYVDRTSGALKYASYDGSAWHIQIADNVENTGFSSLALDPAGQPAISYWGDSSELKYAHYDGTSWQSVTVDRAVGWMGHTSLSFDTLGHPHIGYSTGGGLKYAYNDGVTWNNTTVIPYGIYWAHLALDTSDQPHITAFNYEVVYASRSGDHWETMQVGQSEGLGDGGFGGFTALTLDSANHPRIAYCGSKESLNYAWFDDQEWHTETVDNSLADFCGHGSLALTADGIVNPKIWTTC